MNRIEMHTLISCQAAVFPIIDKLKRMCTNKVFELFITYMCVFSGFTGAVFVEDTLRLWRAWSMP